ncbi:hypothetical protein QJS10_CPB17g00322 [Acorus calamus]|uniref:Uncharacterized protein n=1 Tax=Acorus calamus TaxID=4465 RepID=A0AAV9CX90_ACOCL|nr:hypothetical protein QJS10_CPB17g00322 [Acorus calamus]
MRRAGGGASVIEVKREIRKLRCKDVPRSLIPGLKMKMERGGTGESERARVKENGETRKAEEGQPTEAKG